MPRLLLTIAFLVTIIPSYGMAGVIIDGSECSLSNESSISAGLGDDETPAPSQPQVLKNHREMAGMSSQSVNTTSSSSTAIHCSTELLIKPKPPLESCYGFDEWNFIPESPVFKIPRVPIV